MLKKALASSNPRSAELICIFAVSITLAVVIGSFFGKYAFDDSYVGYSIAQSVLIGKGFTFNHADRVLSTSAPLAVPLYVMSARLFNTSVVTAAQFFSAVGVAIIGYGSYFLARRYTSAIGALSAALVMLSSPFTLLLWSHETVLFLASTILGLSFYISRRFVIASVLLGCSVLFRGEGLVLLPFVWFAEYTHTSARRTARTVGLTLAPFFIWTVWSFCYFGAITSQTIASKRAQLFYPTITPYLYGLRDYCIRLYGLPSNAFMQDVLALIVASCWVIAAGAGLITREYWGLALWVAVITLVYVLFGFPFYFWFCMQIAIFLAATCAVVWRNSNAKLRLFTKSSGRILATFIVIVNMVFLYRNVADSNLKNMYHDWVVMPRISNNAYKSLGLWFSTHAGPNDTISYPEFGQLHYYSGRDIVDYLGLVTSGAAANLRQGNPIWTFKKFRPTWVVISPTWNYFVDPLEYDWFRRSYRYDSSLIFQGDPSRNHFAIFRITDQSLIPAATSRSDIRSMAVHRDIKGLTIRFTLEQPSLSEIEIRLDTGGCRNLKIALSGTLGFVAAVKVNVAKFPSPSRLTLSPPSRLRSRDFMASITGCPGARLAPSNVLRRGFIWSGKPDPQVGDLDSAFIVYE